MKKFIINHKIFVGILAVILVINTWFVISAKRLDITRDGIKGIWIDHMYFTDKKVIDDTVDMLNRFMLRDSSASEPKGGDSPTICLVIDYKNGYEKSYGIYNVGIISELNKISSLPEEYSPLKWYKKYFGGGLAEKIMKFSTKRKHLSVPYDGLEG